MTTIRAWGYEQKFVEMTRVRVNDYTRPYYWMLAANRWLNFRVQLYAAAVASSTGLFILWNMDSVDAGMAGFAMTYALILTDTMMVSGGCWMGDGLRCSWLLMAACCSGWSDTTPTWRWE